MDKESTKRVNEMEGLAYALVGCDLDLEITELRCLSPRGGRATADFEATMRDGRTIRVELARLIDADEKRYLDAIGEIITRARRVIDATPGIDMLTGGGSIVIRFYGEVPMPHDIDDASTELANVIVKDVPRKGVGTTLWPVGADCSTLHRLGAHWAHLTYDGTTVISADASPRMGNQQAATARLLPMFAQKRAKFSDYSEGKPVWLVFYSDTQLFYPIGIVDSLRDVETFDPRPFERVLVGCFTAGVVFETPNEKPRYTSLQTND